MNPVPQPPTQSRTDTVRNVHRVMTRFPMVVELLKKLDHSIVPFPGDDDIAHGCQRALTAMLVELSRIDPAAPGEATNDEEALGQWLSDPPIGHLIDADQLERFQNFIDHILRPQTTRI